MLSTHGNRKTHTETVVSWTSEPSLAAAFPDEQGINPQCSKITADKELSTVYL